MRSHTPVVLLTINRHARLLAFVEAATAACVPIAFADVTVAVLLAANPCRVTHNNDASEERLACVTSSDAVVVASSGVMADSAERAVGNLRPRRHVG